MPRIIAMLPTWNEAENIGPLVAAILALGPDYEALVVDDDSPDGTWRLVGELAAAEPRLHLLHRTANRGRGLAGIAGFREALRLGADLVIEMDADWSHDPRWIPDLVAPLLRAEAPADLVVGSRLVPGGGEEGRPPHRRWITLAANTYIRTMLGLRLRDATSGYRAFSRRCLAALPWAAMDATGPEVVQEVLLAAARRGFAIEEVPILFVERRAGQSTFNARIMRHSLAAMWRLRFAPGELDPRTAERAAPTGLPLALTLPLAGLYGLARGLDRARWRLLPRACQRLDAPVVSVGNLTVGGTGKTPFILHLARLLQQAGHRPAILSRGYGARAGERPLLVGDGERVLARPEHAGDEPVLLAAALRGVPVLAHPSRLAAGRLARQMFRNDVLLLDDGFQHDRLARDFDIVLWDARDLPRRQHLLPAGRLREGLGTLRRADVLVITHLEYLPAERRERRLQTLTRQLKRRAPQAALFTAATRLAGWHWAGQPAGDPLLAAASGMPAAEPPPWRGQPVLLVSGIARPQGFEELLRADGAEVAGHLRYADHFPFPDEEIRRWPAELAAAGARCLVTTAKDAVKFAERLPAGLAVAVAEIDMQVDDPVRLAALLRERLSAHR